MRNYTTRELTLAALVGALYAMLSYFGSFFGLTFGVVQCRVAEALCVLPFLYPCTVPGLFVGCLIANLLSPVGPLDILFGSLATLLAAWWTRHMPNRWLAPFPPVLCNGVIIGGILAWYEVGFGPGFWAMWLFNGVTVAMGELLACYGLGLLLLNTLEKIPRINQHR